MAIDHKTFGPLVDTFVSFASDHLGLKAVPKIEYAEETVDRTSFGGYNPSNQSIILSTKNRHPMDIFRTLAHELVHHKQNEEGRIKDVAKEGSTGSDIENEANSIAGVIMRNFAQKNRKNFALPHVNESFELFAEEHGAGDFGTRKLDRRYRKDTPGQPLAQEGSDGPGPTTGSSLKVGGLGNAYSIAEKKSIKKIRESVKEPKEMGLYSGRSDGLEENRVKVRISINRRKK